MGTPLRGKSILDRKKILIDIKSHFLLEVGQMKETIDSLSRTLRMWREQKGMKMEVAARELGVSTATWGHWEAGRRFPSLIHLSCLSQYLKVPVCRLICCKVNKCTDNEFKL